MRFIITLIKLFYVVLRYRLFSFSKDKSYDYGVRFSRSLEVMGPSFIKLGQTLSTRPDIIGRDVARALEKLQDKLNQFDYKQVEKVFKNEFGLLPSDIFKEFNHKAVAAASVAQVHYAEDCKGNKYAVKILRPGIDKIIKRDLGFLYSMAKIYQLISKKSKRVKPVAIIDKFAKGIRLELDLRMEAAAASEIYDNMKSDLGIKIPKIYWDYTSKKVLTMEWVEGVPLSNIEKIKADGYDLKKIASNLSISFFNQAYRDGVFHGDLHPGNLFVDKENNIVMVDFGIIGRLDKKNRFFIAEILRGFLIKDYEMVAKIHVDAGYAPKDTSIGLFAQALRSIAEPIVGRSSSQISVGKLLQQLFDLTEEFEMETQPQLLLLQKNTMMLEGVGAMLDPDVNLWLLAEPWIETWYVKNLGIEAKSLNMLKKILKLVDKIPDIVDKIIEKNE